MPEKECPYWNMGRCTYREHPIGCTGHEWHVGSDNLYSCSQMIERVKKMIENEDYEQLDLILTSRGETLKFLVKHLLSKAGEKS